MPSNWAPTNECSRSTLLKPVSQRTLVVADGTEGGIAALPERRPNSNLVDKLSYIPRTKLAHEIAAMEFERTRARSFR